MQKVAIAAKKCVCAFVFFICALPFFAFTRVVSPVAGDWANKQSLVLNVQDGAECFYSYSGTDPLTSGFMYDGPVLIDASGPVTVRIVCVSDENREEYQVSYTVTESEEDTFADGSAEKAFIDMVSAQPLYLFTVGQNLTIPESFCYCMEDGVQPYLQGRTLSVSSANKLSCYIPCTVRRGKKGSQKWRFVIFLSGGEAGTLAKNEVPFAITDWNNFVWTGEKLIYAIDDGTWSANKLPLVLDRSESHTIRWQSVAYEAGNPVQTFVLPPKPALTVRSAGGAQTPVVFALEGDSAYRMEMLDSGNSMGAPSNSGLYTQITFDTFMGNAISGDARFAVYCNGVYQGELQASYVVDKKPPLEPVITSSSFSSYARRSVDVTFASEPDAVICYAVSKAISVDETVDINSFDPTVEIGDYRTYNGTPIVLESGNETALFYKVLAFAVDRAGNIGAVTDYAVIIDEYHYYFTENAPDGGDGSRGRPFNDFSQMLAVINSGRFADFYIKGTVTLPAGETVLTSNCAFTSLENARFVLPADGSIAVRSASLAAKNCLFEKARDARGAKKANGLFFKLENAAVSLSACEVVGIFETNGTIFTASSSVIDLADVGLTVQSDSYACGVSASESKVQCKNGRFTAIAPTAVNFSVQGGLFELRSSDCKVISHLGRIAELSRTNARLSDNSFTGEFDTKTSRVSAVWRDDSTLLLENSNNASVGF